MFYCLKPEPREIDVGEISGDRLCAGYIGVDELNDAIARFGFTDVTPEMCVADRDNYRNLVDVYEDYTFGLISVVDVNDVYGQSDRLAFFFRRNLLLVVCVRDEDSSMRALFRDAIKRYKPENVTLEKLIFAILESTIARDAQGLSRVEQRVNVLEEDVALGNANKTLSAQVFEQKKQLLLLRGYYEQLIDIGEALEENENDIFQAESLHYFALLTAKAQRLSNAVNLLCDELNQIRDALAAEMDYRMNHIMEIFTVISGVFLPLTLLVGWYGMNFNNMPELKSPYGYPIFIALCLVVSGAGIIFMKRKRWF